MTQAKLAELSSNKQQVISRIENHANTLVGIYWQMVYESERKE